MKNFFLPGLLLLISFFSRAQTFTPTDKGSKVRFVIKNFGMNTSGTFEGLAGSITFDPANLSTALFNVSVDARTVDTDINSRDNHLRKPEYFDVKKYPKLNFESTKITKAAKPEYLYMFCNIGIKGVTKRVEFPFTATVKDNGYFF